MSEQVKPIGPTCGYARDVLGQCAGGKRTTHTVVNVEVGGSTAESKIMGRAKRQSVHDRVVGEYKCELLPAVTVLPADATAIGGVDGIDTSDARKSAAGSARKRFPNRRCL